MQSTSEFFSVIRCGIGGETEEDRVYSEYSEFYGREVEVFVALEDPLRRHVTRATLLAKILGFENNKVSWPADFDSRVG
jgi:hypothetical protein